MSETAPLDEPTSAGAGAELEFSEERDFRAKEVEGLSQGQIVMRRFVRHKAALISLSEEMAIYLRPQGIGVTVSAKARKMIIDRGFDDKNGARPLRRTIEELVEHPIAEQIIAGTLSTGSIAHVDVDKGKLTIMESHEE